MSWVKALPVSGCDGDVFDEDANDVDIQNKEWMINMKRRLRDGYVDGADFGEDAALESGFSVGLKEGAALTAGVGRLKGIISAMWCWCQLQHPQDPIPASVADLLQSVMKHEDAIVDGLRRTYENPPPTESGISENIADMEVNEGGCGEEGEAGCCKRGEHDDMELSRGDPGCCGEGGKDTGCCKKGKRNNMDGSHQTQHLGFDFSQNLNQLLQRCMDLVRELGLPQELIGHIQEMRTD
ncbi:OTU deubiquitinase with linear linkage specificity a [Genypterus blacodes]|uniref:OTU deubiquitinase with linear linkage specificity a n=1 Tax=Genypterus blacodes TaxID=154954 RepID=UPI003F75E798